MDPCARDPGVMDPGGVIGGQPERDPGHRGDRAGQSDQRPGAVHGYLRRHGVQRRVDVGRGGRDLGGPRRVPVQVPFGQPDAADVDRQLGRRLRHARRLRTYPVLDGPGHELGGPAADVHH